MLRNFAFNWVIFFLQCPFILSAQTTLESTISEVTVYDKGAKITRTASTSIAGGSSTIILTDVYSNLKAHTIQAKTNRQVSALWMLVFATTI